MGGKQHWKNEPDDHDYPAAENYLSLLLPPHVARRDVALDGEVRGRIRGIRGVPNGLRVVSPASFAG